MCKESPMSFGKIDLGMKRKGGPKTSDMKKIFGVSEKHGSTKDIKRVVFGDGGKPFNPFKGK